MRRDQRGFAISGLLYAILILFLFLLLGILALLGSRKAVLDKTKKDIMSELNTTNPATFVFSKDYDYTGDAQVFTVPMTGIYRIELWGARGGSVGSYQGGRGAYTSGMIPLTEGENLYFYVGSQGSDITGGGGYNGGGSILDSQATYGRGGGGASDVRLSPGIWNDETGLNSRIMVAAGGGGANARGEGYGEGTGGAGGSLIGETGEALNHTNGYGYGIAYGGEQTIGGNTIWYPGTATTGGDFATGGFGVGAGIDGGYYAQSAGGGGYYGGGANVNGGAAGGSSYISGHPGAIAITSITNRSPKVNVYTKLEDSYHYSNYVFTDTMMMSGTESMPNPRGNGNIIGNDGNGMIRVTYVGY